MTLRQQILLYFIISSTIEQCWSDIYFHNPRGSNNRHNEKTPERTTAQLSFDSQNNNRGGYNVGDNGTMYYYANSILPIQWTNQHSCNDVNADCTILLQYTCSDTLRDGATTTIIPLSVAGESNSTYRLTESLSSYLNCQVRSRNQNLFTANQPLKGNGSIYTRQNAAGTRYGYECPEERDYYPHWQPNDWIDIAILTNRQDLCDYYRQNSQNVQSRFACTLSNPNDLLTASQVGIILPNSKEACESFTDARLNGVKPLWIEYPSHNQPPPGCFSPSYTRENHLGDTYGSENAVFNWTLPNINASKCVLRIRYNISTEDFDGWKTDATNNSGNLFIFSENFANQSVAQTRGYRYQTNPQIQLFSGVNFQLNLAINTAQYGRVFQDRSYVFGIRQRPASLQNQPIYNLNVRGRRGNIVQVYPAVEYDFVPNRLEMPADSFIHIQWIGSNTSPAGAGQGTENTDRSNLLLLTEKVLNPAWNPFEYLNESGLLSANYPEQLNRSNLLNLAQSDLRLLAASGQNTDTQLNNASAYFDLGLRLVSTDAVGVYHYVSTRNNDFSNRDQKARFIVQPFQFVYQLIGQTSDSSQLGQATVNFPANSVTSATSMKFSQFTADQLARILPINGQNIVNKETLYDSVYVLEPYDIHFTSNIEISIPFTQIDNNPDSVVVLQFEPNKGIYSKLPTTHDSNTRTLKFNTDTGGVFVLVQPQKNMTWLAGVIIPVVLLFIVIISTIIYFYQNPHKYSKVKGRMSQTKLSLFSRI